MVSKTMHVQNMKCAGCSSRITSQLSKIDGISNVQTNLEDDSISFEYASTESLDHVRTALLKMGYPLSDTVNTMGSISKSYLNCMLGKVKNTI